MAGLYYEEFEVGRVFREANGRGRCFDATPVLKLDCDSGTETRKRFLVRLAADLNQIGFRDVRAGFGELLRERAVVGHQQQSFTCVVETPYGINALANTLYQIHDRGTSLRVVHGGDITLRLVEREIEKLFAAREQRVRRRC